jgi:hypothetical protein
MSSVSRKVVPACVRSAALVVGVVASFMSVQALGRPGPEPVVPRPAVEFPSRAFESGFGYERLAAGQRAQERGEFAEADAAYRAAWADAATRDRAAGALTALHRIPTFVLPVDEPGVAETRRLLGSTFQRYDTPHFVIFSDCTSDWSNGRGDLLERSRTQFFRIAERLGLPAAPHRTKLVCVLFADHRQYQAFARAHDGLEAGWVAGYYATLSNRIVFYNDATSPVYEAFRGRLAEFERRMREARTKAEEADRLEQKDLATRLHASADDLTRQLERERSRLGERTAAHSTAKTVHEAIHLLSFNCGVQLPDRDYPFWVSEGLATAFETERPSDPFGPDRSVGGPRRDRYDELRLAGRLAPINDLLSISEVPDWDADTADAMYAQSYTLFSYLYRHDPGTMGGYLRALSAERPGRLTPQRQVDLFTQWFGDPDEVARRMARSR